MRTGFDVPIIKGKVAEDFRIKKGLATIKFLQKKGAKIIILNHLGQDGKTQKPVADCLRKYFKGIKFFPKIFGAGVLRSVSGMKNGDIIMLENLRADLREEKNNKIFAKKLAGLGDLYINDAFSASHRPHASIVGLSKFLASYAGLLFESELNNLENAFKPRHPFLLVLGGVKFESKLGVLDKFLKIADKIFIGGALANNFFRAKGIDIGRSIFDPKVSVKKYLNNKKIVLPVDFKKKDGKILDIGPRAIRQLSGLIKNSKFILWNGPMGNFEMKGFFGGTGALAETIAKSRVFSIVGGGDTVAALEKMGIISKFSFVSTAGGAMLEFLGKGTLPGIEALIKSKK